MNCAVPDDERVGEHDPAASPWFVFNDFGVRNVSEQEALGFPDVWKVSLLTGLKNPAQRTDGKILGARHPVPGANRRSRTARLQPAAKQDRRADPQQGHEHRYVRHPRASMHRAAVDAALCSHRDPAQIKHELLRDDEIPGPGTLVALDAEFVSMQIVRTPLLLAPACASLFGADRRVPSHRRRPSSGPTGRSGCSGRRG